MRVRNVHERALRASPASAGSLLDGLASPEDRMWPGAAWPGMKLDRPLGTGARGGHGPIRYFVQAYVPGRSVRFRFTEPDGFEGGHVFEVLDGPGDGCRLRHVLEMRVRGRARLSWPLLYRPLHDALIEDALTCAQTAVGNAATPVPGPATSGSCAGPCAWSWWWR